MISLLYCVLCAMQKTLACCNTGDGCNNLLMLDGTAGATSATFSLALLFACILVALRV